MKTLTILIEKQLLKDFKREVLEHDKTMTEVLILFIKEYIGESKKVQ